MDGLEFSKQAIDWFSVDPPRHPVGQPAGSSSAPPTDLVSVAADRTEIQEDLESITEVDEDNLTHSASEASVSVSEIDNKHKGVLGNV